MMTQQVREKADIKDTASELKARLKEIKSLSTLEKKETLRLRLEHVGPSVTLFFAENPLKIVQGRGQYLYDELGNEYLDCINNVAHVGHGNARVAAAVAKQLSLLNTNSRFLHDNLSVYAKRLTDLFPAHLSVCYLVNSGSEANDLAIRLARAYTRHKDIVCVDGAYHGNLTSTMAISPYKTHKLTNYKQPKWVHVAPLPCSYRGRYARDQLSGTSAQLGAHEKTTATLGQQIGRLYASASEQVIEEARSRGRQVAGFIVESMISCGGQTELPADYLRQMQKYLRSIGALLICDEVQTGFGRSGKHMWAFQMDGADIQPDIVTCGKPMGNGFPLSAVITRPEVARAFQAIGTEYFNTFGGNPASCAAGLAVLDELEERQLMRRAQEVGDYMLDEMKKLQARHATFVGDVRGCGLFLGMELIEHNTGGGGSKRAAPQYAKFIVDRFRDERILMSTEGKLGNVLKFKPPMVFTMENARRFLQVLSRALAELEGQIMAAKQTAKLPSPASSSSSSAASSSSSHSSRSSVSSWLESSSELE